MALFGKRREPERDAQLPLDLHQAARLRRLVQTSFAEHGIEVTVHADHVTDDAGRRFGLWNVSATCAGAPARSWPRIVAVHVQSVLVSMSRSDGPEWMSDDVLEASTYLRLMELDQIRAHSPDLPHEAIGDGLALVLSVDQPDAVAAPSADFWARRGGAERWREPGRRNLRTLVDDPGLRHQRRGPRDGSVAFDVVTGDSFFTASTALFIEDLVRRFDPGADLGYGVLVATPFRHQVAYAVVTPGVQAAMALHHLFQFAISGFKEGAGPLTPHVYLVRAGQWTPTTAYVDGTPVVRLDGDLARDLGIAGEH